MDFLQNSTTPKEIFIIQKKEINAPNVVEEKYSNVIPLWKFSLLSLATLGIYEFVWFYKTWKFFQKKDGLKIRPLWRAIFGLIWCESLANTIKSLLKSKKLTCTYIPLLVGISYIVSNLSVTVRFGNWKFTPIIDLIVYFDFLLLLPLVNSMNKYWHYKEPDLKLKKFLWWQIILIIIGLCSFLFVIITHIFPK